jgi:hypothetical protein
MARAVSISLLGAAWTAGAFGARVRMGGFLLTKDDIKCETFLPRASITGIVENRLACRKYSWTSLEMLA